MNKLQRPLPNGFDKISYSEHFELRYLRWDYLVKSKNPNDIDIKDKEAIVKYCSNLALKKYSYEFSFMGMGIEDIENIARVYTIPFLSLYSSEVNGTVKERHLVKLKNKGWEDPSDKQIKNLDNTALIYFLNQRLSDCASVFRKKSKGDVGFFHYEVFFTDQEDIGASDSDLIQNYKAFGWKKMPTDKAHIFLKNVQKNNHDFDSALAKSYSVRVDNVQYRIVQMGEGLTHGILEFGDIFDLSSDRTPSTEDVLIEYENTGSTRVESLYHDDESSVEDRNSRLIALFQAKTPERQMQILKTLTKWLKRRNGFQNEMADEIKIVKKLMNAVGKKLEGKQGYEQDL